MNRPPDLFPTDVEGLAAAVPSRSIELRTGDTFDLRVVPIAKRLGGATVRMLSYDGSVPGPTFRVPQGGEVVVDVVNDGDLETTVHWHGIRLANAFDGTPHTQQPIAVGASFSYHLEFPDAGVYWYHPHIREDYAQEMGLYGNIVVVPTEVDYWPPVSRELVLTLDDILLEGGRIAPFRRAETSFVAMGRFGNVLLINGEPALEVEARVGEVVRFYLTNTANTRVFNVAVRDTRMKRAGGDSGHYEHEEFVEGVILAPSERVVVDVLFDRPGDFVLEHRTPDRTYPLSTITVSGSLANGSQAVRFAELRTNADMARERERIGVWIDAPPDKTLALVAEMELPAPEAAAGAAIAYACPMHPEVIQDEPGRCPKCGMKLLATVVAAMNYACPMHPEIRSQQADRCPKCGMKLVPAQLVATIDGDGEAAHDHARASAGHETDGIEWEDDMVEVNRMTTSLNTRWKLIDRDTGAEGAAIDWRFTVGDSVKIRLVNEMDSDHPMHHPFHIHGAGRFLILARDGAPEPNLVWKDTVLVPTGQTVDVLLEVTNPGRWMAHCHIAEHNESGMMFSFDVDP